MSRFDERDELDEFDAEFDEDEAAEQPEAGVFEQLPGRSLSVYRGFPEAYFLPPGCQEFASLFEFYGEQRVRAVRAWAFRWRYVVIQGVADLCAHGLMGVRCPLSPGRCAPRSGWADHARIWAQWDNPAKVFLLAHPYRREYESTNAEDKAQAYAFAHGLELESYPWDGWYGPPGATVPLRLTLPHTNVWPLTEQLRSLFACWPVEWPAEVPEILLD